MKKKINESEKRKSGITFLGNLLIPALFAAMIFTLTSCVIYTTPPDYYDQQEVQPPTWAPYYDNVSSVRYYYLPDIQCFYDVWGHQFIYMMNDRWMWGGYLPSMYSWYDLNSCFVVILPFHIHRPWMQYDYYFSHYPRYYYRDRYRDHHFDHGRPMRGFNENKGDLVFDKPDLKYEKNNRSIDNNSGAGVVDAKTPESGNGTKGSTSIPNFRNNPNLDNSPQTAPINSNQKWNNAEEPKKANESNTPFVNQNVKDRRDNQLTNPSINNSLPTQKKENSNNNSNIPIYNSKFQDKRDNQLTIPKNNFPTFQSVTPKNEVRQVPDSKWNNSNRRIERNTVPQRTYSPSNQSVQPRQNSRNSNNSRSTRSK